MISDNAFSTVGMKKLPSPQIQISGQNCTTLSQIFSKAENKCYRTKIGIKFTIPECSNFDK